MIASSFSLASKLFLVQALLGVATAAPAKVVEVQTNHVVIIDCSGSMYNELPKIRAQLKNKLPKLLKEGDTLSLIWFSGRGEYGVLLEGEAVATLTDLKEVERAIDRWLKPTGLTGFKEPIEEVVALASRLGKKNKNPLSLVFMSDGCDNQWSRGEIIKAVEKASGVLASAAFIEYGYYADRATLSAMAEKAGGQLLFAQDFGSYAPQFEAVLQKRPTGGAKVEVALQGDPVGGFAFSMDGGDLVTYAVEGGKVSVPKDTKTLWYVSPSQVGNTQPCAFGDAVKPGCSNSSMIALPAAYAALSLFSVRMMPDVVLPLLKTIGDVSFIERFGGLFGKQKYSEFMEAAKAAAFDPSQRFAKGYDPSKIPADDAFTVLEALQLLASNANNRVLLDDPRFVYKPIGRGRVDATTVLTDEEQEKIAQLTADLAKTKDVKKAKEISAQISAIADKPEALKFEADVMPGGYPVSSLTYNEEKPNVSLLVRKTGRVDTSKAGAPAGVPAKFDTFIFRNYAIIKDGLINVGVLPVKFDEECLEVLFKANMDGRLPDNVLVSENGVTYLDLSKLPIINRKMVQEVKAQALFENEWALLKAQATQKVYNTALKEAGEIKKSASFAEMYGEEAATWLKEQGFTDYSGFGPKMRQAEATDVYQARELAVSIKGYSAIPSVSDFKKQATKGKLTASAALMSPAMDKLDKLIKAAPGTDQEKTSKVAKQLATAVDLVDNDRRELLARKAQMVFTIIVGQGWFSDMKHDQTTMSLTLDGVNLDCEIKSKLVDVKI